MQYSDPNHWILQVKSGLINNAESFSILLSSGGDLILTGKSGTQWGILLFKPLGFKVQCVLSVNVFLISLAERQVIWVITAFPLSWTSFFHKHNYCTEDIYYLWAIGMIFSPNLCRSVTSENFRVGSLTPASIQSSNLRESRFSPFLMLSLKDHVHHV